MKKKSLLAASFILLLSAELCLAKDWNGIFPLYSTKADVLNRFGKADDEVRPYWYIYRFNEYHVSFEISVTMCDEGYFVPEGRVLAITILPNQTQKWAEVSIPNRQKLIESAPYDSMVDYSDKEEGMRYTVKDGLLGAINYEPSAADDFLRCPKE